MVSCNNQWWMLDILFIFTLLMHMHNGMWQAVVVELVRGVLLFTFIGSFVAFQHGAEGIVIIFHARSNTHYHELMISLVTYRIAQATSVSPQPSPPVPSIPTVILNPQEPPERLESPIPQLHWETNPFWGEPWDSPLVRESQPQLILNQTIVPPGVLFQIAYPICQGSIERSEIH